MSIWEHKSPFLSLSDAYYSLISCVRFYAALEVTISDKISIGLQAYSLKSSPCKVIYFAILHGKYNLV